jgi:hypothetical protein
VAIRCPHAQAAGKSYTKRLLPDFLIPRCVIRLDLLVGAVVETELGRDIDKTCKILGCVDARTVRRHLKRLDAAVGRTALELAMFRAKEPELGDLPQTGPETFPLVRLDVLYRKESEATVRAGGGAMASSLRQMLQAELRKPSGKKPSTSACRSPRPP